jgi:hypothetical protein
MRMGVTVNDVDACETVCLPGLGIIQVPRSGVQTKLAELKERTPHQRYRIAVFRRERKEARAPPRHNLCQDNG